MDQPLQPVRTRPHTHRSRVGGLYLAVQDNKAVVLMKCKTLCIYSALLSVVLSTVLFPVPSASAVSNCSVVTPYNVIEVIKNDATAKGQTFNENTMPYALYLSNDSVRIVYTTTANSTYRVRTSAPFDAVIDSGDTTSYRSTTSTLTVSGAFDAVPQYSSWFGDCIVYGSRLNYDSTYTGTQAPPYTPPAETPPPSSGYWTDEKVKDVVGFFFFAVFDIIFVAWLWHAFTRD